VAVEVEAVGAAGLVGAGELLEQVAEVEQGAAGERVAGVVGDDAVQERCGGGGAARASSNRAR
jgi:hypothetical protein